MCVGVAERGTLDVHPSPANSDGGISTQVYRHGYLGHPDDCFSKFRCRRRPSCSPRLAL
jgi:hypothetical protein